MLNQHFPDSNGFIKLTVHSTAGISPFLILETYYFNELGKD